MAETYLAERRAQTSNPDEGATPFARAVCVKLILPEHSQDPEFRGYFVDEARIHAHLHHDNIVQVYDFGELAGRLYLVLEYVEGCDLRALMNRLRSERKLLPTQLVVALAHELASALDCAHRLSIHGEPQHLVHRDVSPSNVLLSRQGHAKLCDFGVVKARDRAMRTETGGTKGKVPYMSPEQLSTPERVDARTDLFALGVVLFELLTGQHPFRPTGSETDMDVAHRIFSGSRPRVRDLAPETPARLAAVVEQLLASDVHQRTQSAVQLLAELEAVSDAPAATTARRLADYVRATGDDRLPSEPKRAALLAGTSRMRLRPSTTGMAVLAAALALGTIVVALVVALAPARVSRARHQASLPADLPTLAGAPPSLEAERLDRSPVEAAPAPPQNPVPDAGTIEAPSSAPSEVRRAASSATIAHGRARHERAEAESEQPPDAWLDISVQPDGRTWRVWVDGQYQGTADVRVKVAAGKHRVAVGLEQPQRERSVHVASRSTRPLFFKSP